MCMVVLPACMPVHHLCAWCLQRGQKRASDSPRTGAADHCEPPCGRWELNLGPQEKQPVLLTVDLLSRPFIVSWNEVSLPVSVFFLGFYGANIVLFGETPCATVVSFTSCAFPFLHVPMTVIQMTRVFVDWPHPWEWPDCCGSHLQNFPVAFKHCVPTITSCVWSSHSHVCLGSSVLLRCSAPFVLCDLRKLDDVVLLSVCSVGIGLDAYVNALSGNSAISIQLGTGPEFYFVPFTALHSHFLFHVYLEPSPLSAFSTWLLRMAVTTDRLQKSFRPSCGFLRSLYWFSP